MAPPLSSETARPLRAATDPTVIAADAAPSSITIDAAEAPPPSITINPIGAQPPRMTVSPDGAQPPGIAQPEQDADRSWLILAGAALFVGAAFGLRRVRARQLP